MTSSGGQALAPRDADIVLDGVVRRYDERRGARRHLPVRPAGRAARRDRPVRSGQDHDHPAPDRRLAPDDRARSACWARTRAKFRRQHPRADRLHAPARSRLYPDLTAGENVDFVGQPVRDARASRRRRRVREVLELVDLWDVRKPPRRPTCPAGCSAGWSSPARSSTIRRSCSSTSRPPASTRCCAQTIWEELHRLRDAGRTMLVTTQYVNEAESCDRVALIADGRLIALATPGRAAPRGAGGDVIEIETGGAVRRGASSSACRSSGRLDQTRPRPTSGHRRRCRARPRRDVVEAIEAARRRGRRAPARTDPRSTRSSRRCRARTAGRHRRRRRPCADGRADPGRPPGPRRRSPTLARSLTRLLALVGKELVEVVRRPGALLSLVLGPFLIMAVFGLGYNGVHRPSRDGRGRAAGVRPADRRGDLPGSRPAAGSTSPRRHGRGQADGQASRTAASTSSSSRRPTPRREFKAGASARSRGRVRPRRPAGPNYADFLAETVSPTRSTRRSSESVAEGARARTPAVGRQARRRSRPRSSPPRPRPRPRTSPVGAAVLLVLRAGRPRPDPPAPGRDPHRAVARPRTHTGVIERPARLAGQRLARSSPASCWPS